KHGLIRDRHDFLPVRASTDQYRIVEVAATFVAVSEHASSPAITGAADCHATDRMPRWHNRRELNIGSNPDRYRAGICTGHDLDPARPGTAPAPERACFSQPAGVRAGPEKR